MTNKNKFKKEDYRKGKTYEEIYGKERGDKIIKKMSNSSMGYKHSMETKEKIRSSLLGYKHSKIHIERNRLAHLGKPTWNKGLIGYNKGHKVSKKTIEFIKKTFKGKTFEEIYGESKSEKIKEKIRKARAKQIFPIKDTKIELKIQGILTKLHIEYFTHKYISEITNRINQKTIIECDGCYWHGCPICNLKPYNNLKGRKELDKLRTKELEEKGFRVIRLWGCEIKPMELNNFQERLLMK